MRVHVLQCGCIRVDPTVPFGKRFDLIEATKQLTAADKNRITLPVFTYEAAEEVLQTAFGDQAVRDGAAFRIEPYASRKAVFIPAITDVLEAYPKE